MLSKLDMTLHDYRMVTATPMKVHVAEKGYTGSLYDQQGRLIPAAQRANPIDTWQPASPTRLPHGDAHRLIERDCLYLGYYMMPYGHFLLETLSRFWALSQADKQTTLVFHPFLRRKPVHPRRWEPAKTALQSFGFDPANVIFIDKQTRFARLTVPTPLLQFATTADPRLANLYRTIGGYCDHRQDRPRLFSPFRKTAYPRKLFLSRRHLKNRRLVTNDDEVEALFTRRGFAIIYPEKRPFEEQVRMFQRADIIAGFAGSAMHNVLFARPETRAWVLGTGRNPKQPNANQLICNALAQVEASFIPFRGMAARDDNAPTNMDIGYLTEILDQQL